MKELAKKITKKEFIYNQAEGSFKAESIVQKNFIAVFDGDTFSQSTLNYAIQMTRKADALLTGIFLDESIYRSYNIAQSINFYKDPDQKLIEIEKKDGKKNEIAFKQFQKNCSQANINYTFYKNTDITLQELKQKSIFADLLIINSHETFTPFKEKAPSRFIRELLADIQCPVMVVPDTFKPIDRITWLYDGAPPSVFAIKMFSYIFNSVINVPIEVFTVKEKSGSGHLPNHKLIRTFIERHFPKAKFIVANGNAEEQITDHLRNHKGNELVILGAYRRSEISRWFKTSMADILIKALDTPLFIAP